MITIEPKLIVIRLPRWAAALIVAGFVALGVAWSAHVRALERAHDRALLMAIGDGMDLLLGDLQARQRHQ